MAGLFVQKHAEAVNLYCDAKVLYVHADTHIRTFEIVDRKHNDLNEIIVYYPAKASTNVFCKLLKTWNYVRAYWKGYKYITGKDYSPDIVHVNVLTRTGFIAYLYKKWKGVPYVLTEHWTRYLPQNFGYKGFLRKKITELVVRNASAVMPVSISLQQAMQGNRLHNAHYTVVNNVVDDFFFDERVVSHREKKRILHISCFIERAKNVCGMLRAVQALSKQRTDFELIIIGDGPDFDKVTAYARTLDYPPNTVSFVGEQTPHEVANWFGDSDFFVLFSNYETAGVVIAESLASGTPVIATPVGIVPEVIGEFNGYIVDCKDDEMLSEKMNTMLDNYHQYDVESIRKGAIEKFSFKNMGKKIYEIYLRVIG
ncbi:group 1 glycosyl transferase [Candidatus Symbiothrix dinenymphae]|nr:group 1 glycosyl transferase [Candidatus Symbiothrix dinenymphae]